MAIPQYIGGLDGYAALQCGFAAVPVLGPVLGSELVARTVFIVGGVQMAVAVARRVDGVDGPPAGANGAGK